MGLDDVLGLGYLHHIIFVLVHIGVVDAEENAHVLEPQVGTVADANVHLVLVFPEQPTRCGLNADINVRLLNQQTLEGSVKVFFAELHVGEQFVIDALVATAEEVVEDLLAAFFHVALVGVVARLLQVRTEQAVAFHGRSIETTQVLTFRSLGEVGAHIVGIEHVGEPLGLTRIFHRSLMKAQHGSVLVA